MAWKQLLIHFDDHYFLKWKSQLFKDVADLNQISQKALKIIKIHTTAYFLNKYLIYKGFCQLILMNCTLLHVTFKTNFECIFLE